MVTTVTAPDLTARQRAVAQLLTNTGYHARNVTTVISDKPLPDCPQCVYEPQPANCELFHDCGSVLSCRACLISAAAVAVEQSEYGEFSMEITERLASVENTDYGTDYDEFWPYCRIDLDALSEDGRYGDR